MADGQLKNEKIQAMLQDFMFAETVTLDNGGVFHMEINPNFFNETTKLHNLLLISRGLTDADLQQRKDNDMQFIGSVYGKRSEDDLNRLLRFQYQNLKDYTYSNAMFIAMCEGNFEAEYIEGAVVVSFAEHVGYSTYVLQNDDPLDYASENKSRMLDGLLPLPKGNLSNPVEQRLYQMAKLALEDSAFQSEVVGRYNNQMKTFIEMAKEAVRNPRDGDFHAGRVGQFVVSPDESVSQKREKRKNRKANTRVSTDDKIPEQTQWWKRLQASYDGACGSD